MMQIQKGQVKYKDRSDIICTYGINDASKQYYFLDGEKLDNGSYIASTVLVEAIDSSVMATNIGVISSEGGVLVPFENKAIKPVYKNTLLVEKAIPSTQSVIEAVNMRKDPLAATKLVTTPATIKERMNAKMGEGGRFIFNDQFSEASVFDFDGNNLLNGEYYSFIGLNNGTLYMSKNTVDSAVVEYRLDNEEKEKEESIDVREAKVNTDVIEKVMEPVPATEEVERKAENSVKKKDDSAMVANNSNTDINLQNTLHDINLDKIKETDDFVDNKDNGPVLEKREEKEPSFSLFGGLVNNSIDSNTMFNDSNMVENNGLLSENNNKIIDDATEVISKLISSNKEQKARLASYEEKISELLNFKRQSFNESQKLLREIDDYKKKIKDLEKELDNKNAEIKRMEIETNKKEDLAKVLVDAQSLLNE